MLRVDEPFFNCSSERCSMHIFLSVIVVPGISMGIKMNQRNRAIFLVKCPEMTEGDGMVSTHHDGRYPAVEDRGQRLYYIVISCMDIPRYHIDIPVVDTGTIIKYVYILVRIIRPEQN